jgi:hypothetical protein
MCVYYCNYCVPCRSPLLPGLHFFFLKVHRRHALCRPSYERKVLCMYAWISHRNVNIGSSLKNRILLSFYWWCNCLWYCHRYGLSTDNWVYWMLITRNYK